MRVRLVAVLVTTLVFAGASCQRDDEMSSSTTSAPVTTADATGTTSISPVTAATTSAPATLPPATLPTGAAASTTTISSATTSTTTSTTTTTTTATTTATTTTTPTTLAPTTRAPSTTVAPVPAPAVVVDRGTSGRHEVALTFDAGSDVGYAAEILDLLAAEGIRASFGITGAWAQEHPELVVRVAAEGHLLMNHTQTHPHLTQLATADRLTELEAADAVVAASIGRTMRPWFRPPFGDSDASVLADVALAGYRYSVTWTIDSLGWQGLAPADVTRRCLDRAVDGAIVLMHVGSQSTDVAALPDVIAGLRADGYAFVTIEQLVRP